MQEGVPRANNVESAPLWHPRHKGWDGHEYPFGGGAKLGASETCAAWMRTACSVDSVFGKVPTLLAYLLHAIYVLPHQPQKQVYSGS